MEFTVLRQLSQPDVFTDPECNSTRCVDKLAVPFHKCECQCLEDASTFDVMLMRCSRNVTGKFENYRMEIIFKGSK
jgi:hypothetical protein